MLSGRSKKPAPSDRPLLRTPSDTWSGSVGDAEGLSLAPVMRGYRAVYLGHVPTDTPTSPVDTALCVEKILDACNIREINMREVFINFRPYALCMHFVDTFDRVMTSKMYDLARISFCSGGNFADHRIFSWNYKQETEEGFQLECHAVKVASERRARLLSVLVGQAFTSMHQEVQTALHSCRLFRAAFQSPDHVNQDNGSDGQALLSSDSSDEGSCCDRQTLLGPDTRCPSAAHLPALF